MRKTKPRGGSSRRERPPKFRKSESSDRPQRSERPSRFRRDSSFSRDSRPRRSGGDRPAMHKVTCDKCKKECEVPFSPTGNKPVYCSDCFRKNGGSGGSSRGNNFGSELEKINEKLDKIIQGLEL